MANEESNITVPVVVTNIPSTKSVESIDSVINNLYSLLSGKDYKERLKDIVTHSSRIEKSVDRLLRKLESSSTVSTAPSSPTYSYNTPSSTIVSTSTLTPNEGRDNPNEKVVEELKAVREELKEAKDSSANLSRDLLKSKSSDSDNIESQRYTEAREATRNSYNNALEQIRSTNRIREVQERTLRSIDAILDVGKDLALVVKDSFNRSFMSWEQFHSNLKESGMGGRNAAQLSRIVKDTMTNTEDLLGWNISTAEATKASEEMLRAGMNPRYVRENNRQLITGLQSIGLNLGEDTIREFGNAVFDATHVKELVGGWAELISADTENALDKSELSRFLGSNEYKQMLSVIMRNGEYNRADVDEELQRSIRESIRAGFTSKDALNIAQLQVQARLGGGAFLPIPENVQTLIGSAQEAGTFTDIKNLASDLSRATKVMQSDMEVRQRILQTNAGLAANNDFTMFSNLIMNDGHTRRVATQQDIEEGRYEGFLPRIGKALAGILPNETLSTYSMRFTGRDDVFRRGFGEVASSLFKDAKELFLSDKDEQVTLLRKIEVNTARSGSSLGDIGDVLSGDGEILTTLKESSAVTNPIMSKLSPVLGKLTPFLSKAGVTGLAITAGIAALTAATINVVDAVNRYGESQIDYDEAEKNSRESFAQETSIEEQFREALRSGSRENIVMLSKQLNEARERTNQYNLEMARADKDKTSSIIQGIAPFALGPIGGASGIIAGSIFGDELGDLGSYIVQGSTESVAMGNRQKLQRIRGYADGGIVDEEQVAIVGEENNPELILPLTKPERVKELLDQINDSSIAKELYSSLFNKESDSEENTEYNTTRSNTVLNMENLNGYADGGIVDKEQLAVVGEDNKPELILPLTKPERVNSLLSAASNLSGTDNEVADILDNSTNSNTLGSDLVFNNSSREEGVEFMLPEKDTQLEANIDSFVSKLESVLTRLNSIEYRRQIESVTEDSNKQEAISRVLEDNHSKLVDSLNELNRTVQESNRLTRSTNTPKTPSISTLSGRRYF